MPEASAIDLPPLRQELRIEPGPPQVNGAPSWTLFDPVRHTFFQLGRIEFTILSHWANGKLDKIKDGLARNGLEGQDANEALSEVADFIFTHNLSVSPPGDTVGTFSEQRAAMRKSWWRWLVENYLFVRIPLVKPDAFLDRTLHKVEFLFTRSSMVLFGIAALVGLLLVSRQWDAFFATFLHFFSMEGLVAYGIGLIFVKILHELGHAYVAKKFGCRISSMGVAFLVMMPVLYTDTSSAWRLRSRSQRLQIDCAGVMVELMVATVATLVWVALPDGTLRSVAFILAATSWIMSLAVNLNPFMRFDGYYVLADLSGIPNLQPRAFAFGRWRLREFLFGLGDAPPEQLPKRTRRWMTVYAYATWLYRLVLFIGIALLVYHLFFKLLGIILFVLEIAVFIARPVLNEFRAWHAMKDRIAGSRRAKVFATLVGLTLLALILPLDRNVTAPAVLSTSESQPLVSGAPALLEEVMVENGAMVVAGTEIARLSAPDIDRQIALHMVRIAQLQGQTGRATADIVDRANLQVLQRELASERLALAGLEGRRDKLTLVAPIDGMVVDIGLDMKAGRWLGGDEPVARIVTPGNYDVQAYINEDELWRLENGANARFVPNDPAQASRAVRVEEIAAAAAESLALPILGSPQGGPIAAMEESDGSYKAREAIYRIRLTSRQAGSAQAPLEQTVPGVVVVRARSSSVMMNFFRSVSRVWQEERPL